MTDLNEWAGQVGSTWAEEWRRTDRSFGELTDLLLDLGNVGHVAHVLDIGCGAGELSLRIAEANPQARVLGIDISAELLAVAVDRADGLANVRFAVADAATWCAEPASKPDLLISRHGVMFFPDPVAAFIHLREQATPGARLRFSCFRERGDNGWVAALDAVLPMRGSPDPNQPGPFAFADRARVEAILTAAGWEDMAFEPVDYAMIAGVGENAVEQALGYFQRIGPAARALAEMAPGDREAAQTDLRAVLTERCQQDRVALPAAAWIVSGRARDDGRRL